MERLLDWLFDNVMPAVAIVTIVLVAATFFVGLPVFAYCAWQDLRSPTFDLRKDEWSCAASHSETGTTMIVVGKVLVPSTSTTTVCDRWDRRS